MPRDSHQFSPPKLHYPTIIISDLHLGKRRVVEAELLLEFLQNTESDTLILNGDIIDGWYLEKHKHRPFPESHARVLDALNRKAAEGTRVIYLPGNHDERLRYTDRRTMERNRLDKDKPEFSQKIIFKDPDRDIFCPVEFVSDMVYEDRAGRHMRILHGDIFDPPWTTGTLAMIGDQFYDALVVANNTFSELSKRFNGGTRFSIAKLIKKNTKNAVGIISNFESAASNLPDDIDGMICGHIHHAEITDNHGKLYVNSGDWIESCTAAVEDHQGNWGIIHWENQRRALGLKKPSVLMGLDSNPNAEFRGVTQRQLRYIQHFWPASNRDKVLGLVARGKREPAFATLVAA